MWAELKRIVKRNGAIVLFGSQPFTSALVMSNPRMFKYEWIWEKHKGTDFVLSNKRPMKIHENVLVFYEDLSAYNPQKIDGSPYSSRGSHNIKVAGVIPAKTVRYSAQHDPSKRLPTSIQRFPNHNEGAERHHETQKPVELLRYLVRTYTNEGDTVLDFTCGSGTTGVACVIERRNCVLIEQDAHYCEVSVARIKRAQGIACDIPKRTKHYAPTPLFEEVLNFEAVA